MPSIDYISVVTEAAVLGTSAVFQAFDQYTGIALNHTKLTFSTSNAREVRISDA